MDKVHVFVYCNPSSGGNKARKLLELPIGKSSFAFEDKDLNINIQVRIYDLKTEASRLEGFDCLAEFKNSNQTVRAVAAGGDGTVKWVISELERIKCVDVPIGVIPFGTGNDMARILGWGSTAPNPLIGGDDMPALKRIIRDLVMGEPLSLDVWRVETRVDKEDGRFEVAIKGEIVERKDKAKVVIDHMINYCSFGQDARAVFGFERHRRTTQFMNKVQFTIEGGKLAFQPPRKLDGAHLTVNGKDIPAIDKHQGIIFQNIPSYAAGSDFWDKKQKWTPGDRVVPQMVGDGLLETHTLDGILDIGLHKATLGFRDATGKLGQASKLTMKFEKPAKQPLYCQVDGEPCKIINPESCDISLAFQVKMISRNDAKLVLVKSLTKGGANDHVLQSGFLLKARKNPAKDSWNSRFVALVGRENGRLLNLEWFLGDKLRGHLCILKEGKMQVRIEKIDHEGPRPNSCFSVISKHKSVHFAAKSAEEREMWLQSLGFSSTTAVTVSPGSASPPI